MGGVARGMGGGGGGVRHAAAAPPSRCRLAVCGLHRPSLPPLPCPLSCSPGFLMCIAFIGGWGGVCVWVGVRGCGGAPPRHAAPRRADATPPHTTQPTPLVLLLCRPWEPRGRPADRWGGSLGGWAGSVGSLGGWAGGWALAPAPREPQPPPRSPPTPTPPTRTHSPRLFVQAPALATSCCGCCCWRPAWGCCSSRWPRGARRRRPPKPPPPPPTHTRARAHKQPVAPVPASACPLRAVFACSCLTDAACCLPTACRACRQLPH